MDGMRTDLEGSGFALVETHISWVFLGKADVFKVKRPVDLGFLDFSSVEKRHDACLAEVELNARLAPDVYLGVVPVTRDARGRHAFAGTGEIVDWAVHMRRLRDEDRADVQLAEQRLTADHVKRLADHVADFHARARCDAETQRYGQVEAIRGNVCENFAQTRDTITRYLTEDQSAEIEAWQLERLTDTSRFVAREQSNHIRDGHGDLRLEHVYFEQDGTIAIIDCIEFNERFRYADVCADIAFLSMDLAWHGRPDLAELFLSRYAAQTDDYDLYSVVNFYESYRAFVRGKVVAILADDPNASKKARARARRQARRYFLLSLAFEREPLESPRLVAIGGLIASGKSTVASEVADLLAAPLLGSDRTRKRLAGKNPTDSMRSQAWENAYDTNVTDALYAELLRRAEVVLTSGRPVVIDASFRSRAMREEARALAARLGVPFTFVECIAPEAVCLTRLAARARTGPHESDADLSLWSEFRSRYEPVCDLRSDQHLRIDTTQPLDSTRRRLQRELGLWQEEEA